MGPNNPSSNFVAKNKKFAWKEFRRSIKPYMFLIIVSIILAVGSAMLALFIPKILGDMTNIAVNSYPEIDWGQISGKAVVVILLFSGAAILNYAQAFILAVVSARYTRDLRAEIITKIPHFFA